MLVGMVVGFALAMALRFLSSVLLRPTGDDADRAAQRAADLDASLHGFLAFRAKRDAELDARRAALDAQRDELLRASRSPLEAGVREDSVPKDLLSRMLDNARADGMGEALEIAKAEACVDPKALWQISWEHADAEVAERQLALRAREGTPRDL